MQYPQVFRSFLSLAVAGLLAAGGARAAPPQPPPANPPSPAECAAAATQAVLNACAYEEFLVSQAELAESLRRLQQGYDAKQREGLRRVQKAWLGFRTEACAFESSGATGGSVRPMVQWQCAARMSRERSAALAQMGQCPEGDVACVRPASAAPSPR